MERAFDEGAANMRRQLERRRRPPSAAPENLVRAIIGAVKGGFEACGETALIALAGAVRALDVAYDGDLTGIVHGSPAQARALRALRDDGDAGHFLRVEGQKGADALLLDILELLPAAAFAERAAEADADRNDPDARALADQPRLSDEPDGVGNSFKSFDLMTIPELHEWRSRWVDAAYLTAEYLAGLTRDSELRTLARGGEPSESREAAATEATKLKPHELLLMFAVGDAPRGYAGGDERTYQAVQTIRKRLRRRVDKASERVSE